VTSGTDMLYELMNSNYSSVQIIRIE